MRAVVPALVLMVSIGCASSSVGGGSARMGCEDRYDTVFQAAQSAVLRLGGKIVHSSRSSGRILGRIEVDVLGFGVELSVALSRLPDHDPGTLEPISVDVRASESGVSDPDPERAEELRSLEEQYLELVGERATCGSLY